MFHPQDYDAEVSYNGLVDDHATIKFDDHWFEIRALASPRVEGEPDKSITPSPSSRGGITRSSEGAAAGSTPAAVASLSSGSDVPAWAMEAANEVALSLLDVSDDVLREAVRLLTDSHPTDVDAPTVQNAIKQSAQSFARIIQSHASPVAADSPIIKGALSDCCNAGFRIANTDYNVCASCKEPCSIHAPLPLPE